MHVLILNQTFYPDFASTAQLMWELAVQLRGRGHRISALASRAVYGTDQQHALTEEVVQGIRIHRVAGTAFGKRRLRFRLADFLSFYAAAFVKLGRLPKPDVILSLTTPPMLGALPMLHRQFHDALGKRPRIVHHIMDLYPDAAVAMGVLPRDTILHRTMARLTRRTLETSDGVIVLGRDMAERVRGSYLAHHGREPNLHIVPPWADGSLLWPIDKAGSPLAGELGVRDKFTIVYSGNLGMAHDVETLVGAIDLMRGDADTEWLFIGGGKRFDDLRQLGAGKAWEHVRFLPYQDRERLNESLNLADVHLVSQLPAFTGIVVPSKLYGILAVGKPSVMVGPAGAECSRVISETASGYVIPNGDAPALARALRYLRANADVRRRMGERARRAFEAEYDRPIACSRIEAILQSVVDRR